MTDEQMGDYVKERISEIMGSYIIVGFRSDNHTPLIISKLPDTQAAIAINAVLCGILGTGGFAIDAQKE